MANLIDAGGSGAAYARGIVAQAQAAILPEVRRLIDESIGRIAVRAGGNLTAIGIRSAVMFDPAATAVVDDPDHEQVIVPLTSGATLVGAKAHDTGGIVCASGSITTVALDAEYWDTGTFHDVATNNERVTVPSDGYYRVSARVELERHLISATADPFYGLLQLLRSGSTVAEDMVSTTPAAFNAGHRIVLKIEEVFHCTAGQYFSLTIQQNAGVAVVTNADSWRQARLGVERVG
jgi:hypothetical protein